MVDSPVPKRRSSRRKVRRILAGLVAVIIVLAVAGGVWLYLTDARESSQASADKQRQERAKQTAVAIGGFFSGIHRERSELAEQAAVVSLFERADAVELAERTAEYQNQFEKALNLRFLLPGGYSLDSDSQPPLSYACMDMLRKAENSSGVIGTEVHLYGDSRQHIVLVERVRNQANQLIGLIHLSLDVALFDEAVEELTLTDAYIELRQSAGGQSLVLAKQGDPANKNGKPVITSIANSRWNLAYWGSSSPSPQSKTGAVKIGGLTPLALVALVLLLLTGVYVVLRRRRTDTSAGSGSEQDSVVYAGAVKNIMDGAHPGMENLVPDLPKVSGNRVKEKAAPSEALVSDDITMVMQKEDLEDQARELGNEPQQQAQAKTAPEQVAQPVDKNKQKSETGKGKMTQTQAAEKNKQKATATEKEQPKNAAPAEIDPVIFRAYDIRGVVGKTLTSDVVSQIGRSIGSEAQALGEKTIVVGRDGRRSSPELAESLIKGLRSAGCDVIDVGEVPTPVLYYAAHTLDANSGVMLTGSHNGPAYNGLKIVLGGETLSEAGIQKIRTRITEGDLSSGKGRLQTAEVVPDYIRRISEDIPVALGGSYKLVVDCGNGVAGSVAPQLFRALGHDVIELYCDVDGSFPNHHPDPSQPENMEDLIKKVKAEGADLGFAFDGDGDRLGVVDGNGNIIWPDRQLMVLAKDVLSRNAGAEIIFDVKCSRYLKDIIEAQGGKALMWKTGHSLIKAKMKEVDAPLAGEMSGHIFFKERWYGFDDAMYTAARLLEVLVNTKAKPAEFFAEIPEGVSTPELRIDLPEAEHKGFMQKLESGMSFDDAEVVKVDGLRIEFPDGWGLIRPSNTSPCLVLRFEADNDQSLARIQAAFRDLIQSINPDLKLPF